MTEIIECEITGRIPSDGRIRLHQIILDQLADCPYELTLRFRKVSNMVRQKGKVIKLYENRENP